MTNYYMGIDGGGTRCRARLEDADGNLLGNGEGGSANIMRNLAQAQASIVDACSKAVAASGLSIALKDIAVGAGLAGANIPDAYSGVMQWQHPFHSLSVLSDLHAACIGAHHGENGAVIVCGTGSSATRYVDGVFTDIGGHGFLVGDKASGAWLGLNAVQHALMSLDGLQSADALSQAVCRTLNVSDEASLVQRVNGFEARDYAALAPALVTLKEAGDAVTAELFSEGLRYLQRIAEHLLSDNALPLSLIGGLTDTYKTGLPGEIRSRIRPCQQSPEQGAIAYHKHNMRERSTQ